MNRRPPARFKPRNGHVNGVVKPPIVGVVPLHSISKEQLAHAFNQKLEECKGLRAQLEVLGKAMTAIVQNPEAFHYQDGPLYIEIAAMDLVKPGTVLTFDERDGKLYAVAVTPPEKEDEPKIEIPE